MIGTMPAHPIQAVMACTATNADLLAQFVCTFQCISVQPAGFS